MGSGRWKPVAPTDRLFVLADLLERLLSHDAAVRRAAEQKLSESIAWPDYALGLLSLIASQSPRYDDKACHAASVHLNNLIRLRWPKPSSDADRLPLPDFECSFIKESILNLLLTASPPIQVQVAESIAAIAATDFPSKWESILPSIVSSLGTALLADAGDIANINSLLVAAASLFSRFRNASDQQGDLDYCIAEFADTLHRVVEFTFQRLPDAAAATDPLEPRPVFECLRLSFQIFQSLNSTRLHPTFKAQMANWMKAFLFFLKTLYQPSVEEDGAADMLRAAVCDNLQLFTEKHEKEFGGYMVESVEAVCRLLVARTASPSRAQLAVTGIRFLTTVADGVHHTLFGSPETMKQIYDSIVVPNLRVRDDDEELFGGNWVEYVRRDSEGSSADTIRWAVCRLLQGLSTNYRDQVDALVSAHVQKMSAAFTADQENNWKEKDGAIYLVIAIMQKPGSTAGGTPMVDVQSFFTSVIVPELQHSDWYSEPMLKATVLRFLKEFRDQIPKASVLFLLPSVVRFLTHGSNVLHSYAATFIESLLIIMEEVLVPGVNTVTRSQSYVASDINSVAPLIIQNLATALGFPGSYENPYIIKCLMRVLRVANIDGHTVCGITNRLVQILTEMCNYPKNSDFNSYLFEALVAVVTRFGSSVLPPNLLTVLVTILCQDIPEFVPYSCKVLAQVVTVSKSFDQENRKILALLLSSAAWDRPPSVPACLCLLRAFLPRVSNQDDELQNIISKLENLLSRVSTEDTAFHILNTLVEDLHHDIMNPYIENIWLALFGRLQTLLPTGWVVKFANCVVVSMSLIVLRYGYGAFESSIRVIESNKSSFTQFIKRFWIPNLALIKGGRDVKLTAVASIELLCRMDCPIDMWGRLLDSTFVQLLRDDIQYAGMGEDPLLKDVDLADFFSRSCDKFSAKFSGNFGHIINTYVHPPHRSHLQKLCRQRNINI